MSKKHWEFLGFWAMGLLLFIAMMILIRWVIDFVSWSTIDSGWAQALGSIAALAIAIYVMREQAKFALKAETRQLVRQAHTVAIIVKKLNDEMLYYSDKLKDKYAAAENLHDLKDTAVFVEVSKAIDAIPLHSLGSPKMVSGIFEMQKAANGVRELLHQAKLFTELESDFDAWNGDEIAKSATFIRSTSGIAYGTFLDGVTELESGPV